MIAFLTIMTIGFLVLLLSLLLGELSEHGGELIHDIAGDHDHGDGDHAHGGPSFFSVRIIAAFVTGFGGAGAVGMYLEWHVVLSSLLGLAGAFALAGIVYAIVSFLFKQQASSNVEVANLAGEKAIVNVGIPENGLGEVTLIFRGRTVTQLARAKDGKAIMNGTSVTIMEVVGDQVLVG